MWVQHSSFCDFVQRQTNKQKSSLNGNVFVIHFWLRNPQQIGANSSQPFACWKRFGEERILQERRGEFFELWSTRGGGG